MNRTHTLLEGGHPGLVSLWCSLMPGVGLDSPSWRFLFQGLDLCELDGLPTAPGLKNIALEANTVQVLTVGGA